MKALYEGGLSVRTTLSPRLQRIAERRLREGLIAYDRRHGWRGPIGRLEQWDNWKEQLQKIDVAVGGQDWEIAVVAGIQDEAAEIRLADGRQGIIPLSELKWAREVLPDQERGPEIEKATDVLAVGDIILVEELFNAPVERQEEEVKRKAIIEANDPEYAEEDVPTLESADDPVVYYYGLRQVPEIGGGLVAMDPHSGRVLAMTGGFDYDASEFNRAV